MVPHRSDTLCRAKWMAIEKGRSRLDKYLQSIASSPLNATSRISSLSTLPIVPQSISSPLPSVGIDSISTFSGFSIPSIVENKEDVHPKREHETNEGKQPKEEHAQEVKMFIESLVVPITEIDGHS
eukprot:TRINITY_DN1276_c0_g1_i2.p1 TRINITY_DN1276_c0_g1~~TRINITY_DN1276_c0_g1_i2.p1  ORF type:complete len:126 (-),score=33.07 TRINITY_DN1276_c0_g1_i2:22-399(-)